MNQHCEGQNEALLAKLFSEDEVQAILKVPMSTMMVKNRLVWNTTTNGQFSVKFGYKIAKNIKQKASDNEGFSTRREEDKEKLWKKV